MTTPEAITAAIIAYHEFIPKSHSSLPERDRMEAALTAAAQARAPAEGDRLQELCRQLISCADTDDLGATELDARDDDESVEEAMGIRMRTNLMREAEALITLLSHPIAAAPVPAGEPTFRQELIDWHENQASMAEATGFPEAEQAHQKEIERLTREPPGSMDHRGAHLGVAGRHR